MRQGSDPLEPTGSRCWVNGTRGGLYIGCDLRVALYYFSSKLSRHKLRQRIDQKPKQPAYQRAVDPDELQVAAQI